MFSSHEQQAAFPEPHQMLWLSNPQSIEVMVPNICDEVLYYYNTTENETKEQHAGSVKPLQDPYVEIAAKKESAN